MRERSGARKRTFSGGTPGSDRPAPTAKCITVRMNETEPAVAPPTRLLVSALCVLAVALLACGKLKEKLVEKATEKAVEQATGQDVDVEKDRVTIKDGKGNTAEWGAGAKLPDDWPKELAPYPGAKLVASFATRKNNKLSGTISMTTTDSADKVFSHYDAKLAGFTLKSETNLGTTRIKQFEKDGRQVTINVIPEDKITRANIVAANY